MPELMASHWGVSGEVNGYMSKFLGLFFMPFLSTFLYILFKFLPKLEPYQKNFIEFKDYFNQFIFIIFGFLFYIYLLTIFWNLGCPFNFIQYLTPAFFVIFYFTGTLLSHTKPNWFVGIRTPWTMSSEKVWKQTHLVGAKLFKLVAIISLLGIIWPTYVIYFLFLPLLSIFIFIFGYSYWLYLRR